MSPPPPRRARTRPLHESPKPSSHRTRSPLVVALLQSREGGLHGGVVPRQPLDGEVLGLVVGQAQVALAAQKRVFGLLQMVDGLVDLIDGLLELAAGQLVV